MEYFRWFVGLTTLMIISHLMDKQKPYQRGIHANMLKKNSELKYIKTAGPDIIEYLHEAKISILASTLSLRLEGGMLVTFMVSLTIVFLTSGNNWFVINPLLIALVYYLVKKQKELHSRVMDGSFGSSREDSVKVRKFLNKT